MTMLSTSAYAAYILHFIFVIILQAVLIPVMLPSIVKFLIVVLAGWISSFGIGYMLKKIPGLRKVI